MTGAGALERSTTSPSRRRFDNLREPRIRFTIIFHAPFDRVFALTSLGSMGVVLVWATAILVQIAGAIIAATTLPRAYRILVREFKTPRIERGMDIRVDVLDDRPPPYVNTVESRRS